MLNKSPKHIKSRKKLIPDQDAQNYFEIGLGSFDESNNDDAYTKLLGDFERLKNKNESQQAYVFKLIKTSND